MICSSRPETNASAKIRELANSADYDPLPAPSHGPKPSPSEAAHTPPKAVPELRKMPVATLWDPKTGKQIYTPPKTSPVGKRKGPSPSKTTKAPATPAFPGPKLGTFFPSGKRTVQALHPKNDSELGPAQKRDESKMSPQKTNQEHSENSQETDEIEGLIKDIQEPLEGMKLDTLEPDSQVSRDQAMVGSTHAALSLALLNVSPGKRKGMSIDQPAEPVRVKHTTGTLAPARNIGGQNLTDEGARG